MAQVTDSKNKHTEDFGNNLQMGHLKGIANRLDNDDLTARQEVELQAQEYIGMLDLNADGVVTAGEMKESMRTALKNASPEEQQEIQAAVAKQIADLKASPSASKFTPAELQSGNKYLDKISKNVAVAFNNMPDNEVLMHDDSVVKNIMHIYDQMDANHDGTVTPEELENSASKKLTPLGDNDKSAKTPASPDVLSAAKSAVAGPNAEKTTYTGGGKEAPSGTSVAAPVSTPVAATTPATGKGASI